MIPSHSSYLENSDLPLLLQMWVIAVSVLYHPLSVQLLVGTGGGKKKLSLLLRGRCGFFFHFYTAEVLILWLNKSYTVSNLKSTWKSHLTFHDLYYHAHSTNEKLFWSWPTKSNFWTMKWQNILSLARVNHQDTEFWAEQNIHLIENLFLFILR